MNKHSVQMDMECNVTVRFLDGSTFKPRAIVNKRNRVTNIALYGAVKLFYGSFSDIDELSDYIPKYFAFGDGASAPTPNDTQLGNELTDNESAPERIVISQRNIVNNNLNNGVVKLVYRAYTDSTFFNGRDINEAGLFIDKEGNNCFARISFDTLQKDAGEVLDILWEINIRSTTTAEGE